MLFALLPLVTLVPLLPRCAVAQFPPRATYTNITKSPINDNITISFKSPEPGTCTTVFSSQKQYTGYITLPPYTLAPIQQNYSINTFFWFVEARNEPETAPLSIWLSGGPGSSSMIGLFQESGPCEVVQAANGLYGTQARIWGWDRSSNVLYIDQPSQVGFSYDEVTEGSHNLLTDEYTYPPADVPDDVPAYAFLNGSFGSGNVNHTANTTEIAAHAVWHFLQGFLATFPQYNPGTRPNDTSLNATGVNLFAESYGGMYGPTFADFFEEQNTRRANGTIPNDTTLDIELTSLGIINGLVDELIQSPTYATFPNNNTYDIQAFDETTTLNTLYNFNKAGGCKDLTTRCRTAAAEYDAEDEGDVYFVNELCSNASVTCNDLMSSYAATNLSVYDIRQPLPDNLPSGDYQEYLNYAAVQQSIGVPINYTESNAGILNSFYSTGDAARGTQLASLARLLALNIRIAFIYGDADVICNWVGGEAVSLALAALDPAYAFAFPAAGYADLVVNSTYIGGAVRSYGNLSFARIYDAGHMVPAYQPETAFTLFTRIITGVDLSTGEALNASSSGSEGPANATHTNKAPSTTPSPTCWLRALADTCPASALSSLSAGKGAVEAGVWYASAGAYDPPGSNMLAGFPGAPIPTDALESSVMGSVVTSTASAVSGSGGSRSGGDGEGSVVTVTVAPTGVYVASGTPGVSAGVGGRVPLGEGAGWGVAALVGLVGAAVL